MEGPVEGAGGTWSTSSTEVGSGISRGSWAGSGVKSAGTVSSFLWPAGRVGSRPARTRMCARAGATVRSHPLTAV